MEFSNFRKLLLSDKQSTVEIKEVENGFLSLGRGLLKELFFFFFFF